MKRIETHRLVLRSFSEHDLNDLYAYASQPEVGPNAGWRPHRSKKESRLVLERFLQQQQAWAIEEKLSFRLIGSVGLYYIPNTNPYRQRNLGYVLNTEVWGNGYMTEAVQAVLQYAFEELRLDFITADHFPYNNRSKRILDKFGFSFLETKIQALECYDGQAYDLCHYQLTYKRYMEWCNEAMAVRQNQW